MAALQDADWVSAPVPASSQAGYIVSSSSTAGMSHGEAGPHGRHCRPATQKLARPVHAQRGRIEVDESDPQPAACGVRVVWTSVEARRHGIATQLLNAAR